MKTAFYSILILSILAPLHAKAQWHPCYSEGGPYSLSAKCGARIRLLSESKEALERMQQIITHDASLRDSCPLYMKGEIREFKQRGAPVYAWLVQVTGTTFKQAAGLQTLKLANVCLNALYNAANVQGVKLETAELQAEDTRSCTLLANRRTNLLNQYAKADEKQRASLQQNLLDVNREFGLLCLSRTVESGQEDSATR